MEDYSGMSFAQAFRTARAAAGGPGGVFMWRGKPYTTRLAVEPAGRQRRPMPPPARPRDPLDMNSLDTLGFQPGGSPQMGYQGISLPAPPVASGRAAQLSPNMSLADLVSAGYLPPMRRDEALAMSMDNYGEMPLSPGDESAMPMMRGRF